MQADVLERQVQRDAAHLWNEIKDGRCIAWVGAGMSMSAGYLGWSAAIKQLCSDCHVLPLLDDDKDTEHLLDKADACQEKDRERYEATLATLFNAETMTTRKALNYLFKLPFKGFVTTNFDPSLMEAGYWSNDAIDVYRFPSLPASALGNGRPSIFYIHGTVRKRTNPNRVSGKDVIFSRHDFNRAYSHQSILSSFLTQLFTYEKVLFMGCQLSEPELQHIFACVRRIHDDHRDAYAPAPSLPTKIILVSHMKDKGGSDDPVARAQQLVANEHIEDERFRGMDIMPIRYPADQHEYLERVLEAIKHMSGTPALRTLDGYGEEGLPS